MPSAASLKTTTLRILEAQGYTVEENKFFLKDVERETKRNVHVIAKAERVLANEKFIRKKSEFIKQFMVDGKDVDVSQISPVLIEVKPNSKWETIFRWWNLVWWSLPYERSYGRQMRFIVWDKQHKAPVGLIGLQSPILNWAVRDNYLGIEAEERDFWVNHSLSAQRLGALPPYNNLLGGKLVASMMTTDYVRRKFHEKYSDLTTVIKERRIPANLLFITTTGAYGKSSVYSRLKMDDKPIAKFIGYTKGAGSFHIPNFLYQDLLSFLQSKQHDIRRGYGFGPSRKLKLIKEAMKLLGIPDGTNHAVQRSVYIFPFAENIDEVIHKGARPKWIHRSQPATADFWKEKWAIPRSEKDKKYLEFSKDEFLRQSLEEFDRFREIINDLSK